MYKLDKNENDKILKIIDFYNKVCENPISEEEINKFIEDVVNLSISINKDLSEVLDVCYEFAYRFFKISDICGLARASILMNRIASIK